MKQLNILDIERGNEHLVKVGGIANQQRTNKYEVASGHTYVTNVQPDIKDPQ